MSREDLEFPIHVLVSDTSASEQQSLAQTPSQSGLTAALDARLACAGDHARAVLRTDSAPVIGDSNQSFIGNVSEGTSYFMLSPSKVVVDGARSSSTPATPTQLIPKTSTNHSCFAWPAERSSNCERRDVQVASNGNTQEPAVEYPAFTTSVIGNGPGSVGDRKFNAKAFSPSSLEASYAGLETNSTKAPRASKGPAAPSSPTANAAAAAAAVLARAAAALAGRGEYTFPEVGEVSSKTPPQSPPTPPLPLAPALPSDSVLPHMTRESPPTMSSSTIVDGTSLSSTSPGQISQVLANQEARLRALREAATSSSMLQVPRLLGLDGDVQASSCTNVGPSTLEAENRTLREELSQVSQDSRSRAGELEMRCRAMEDECEGLRATVARLERRLRLCDTGTRTEERSDLETHRVQDLRPSHFSTANSDSPKHETAVSVLGGSSSIPQLATDVGLATASYRHGTTAFALGISTLSPPRASEATWAAAPSKPELPSPRSPRVSARNDKTRGVGSSSSSSFAGASTTMMTSATIPDTSTSVSSSICAKPLGATRWDLPNEQPPPSPRRTHILETGPTLKPGLGGIADSNLARAASSGPRPASRGTIRSPRSQAPKSPGAASTTAPCKMPADASAGFSGGGTTTAASMGDHVLESWKFDRLHEFSIPRPVNTRPSSAPSNAFVSHSNAGSRELGGSSFLSSAAMRSAGREMGRAVENPPSPRPSFGGSSSVAAASPHPSLSTDTDGMLPRHPHGLMRQPLASSYSVTPRNFDRAHSFAVTGASPSDSTHQTVTPSTTLNQTLPPPSNRYSMLKICENLPRNLYSRRSL